MTKSEIKKQIKVVLANGNYRWEDHKNVIICYRNGETDYIYFDLKDGIRIDLWETASISISPRSIANIGEASNKDGFCLQNKKGRWFFSLHVDSSSKEC